MVVVGMREFTALQTPALQGGSCSPRQSWAHPPCPALCRLPVFARETRMGEVIPGLSQAHSSSLWDEEPGELLSAALYRGVFLQIILYGD